jgi:outer membrane receptor protein involved in Fe transport
MLTLRFNQRKNNCINMRNVFLMAFCLFAATNANAQMPPGMGGRPAGQSMNVGHFYGKIVDEKTNKGIEAVSVQLLSTKFDTISKKRVDTILGGMLTRKSGDFSIEGLPVFGKYRLRITAIGYKEVEQAVAFELKMGKPGDMSAALAAVDKDLGNIKLEMDSKVLESVTVSASKPLMSMGIDRKVFNVEKNINSAGGNAADIMRSIPALSVDIDGNVTMRNNAPQLFVDGRPTNLTLDQIPADAIASVELITNPSAKFDASGGTAGILNIVLKKNRKTGYNGTLRAGIDQRAKVNLGGDINVRQGKFNVFANANYNERKSISTGHTERQTFITGKSSNLAQNDKNINDGYFAFGRAGFDYFINNRNTISASGVIVRGNFQPNTNSDIFIDNFTSGGTLSTFSNRSANTDGGFRNLGGQLSYKKLFVKPGRELTADINFNRSKNDNNTLTSTRYFDKYGGTQQDYFDQRVIGGGSNKFVTLQADYVSPITDKAKIEFGARMQIRDVDSKNDISQDTATGIFFPVPQLSSNYINKDKVYAGYLTFSNSIKDFGYQIGLRVESSEYEGDVRSVTAAGKDTASAYSNNFPISLFPSIFLSQKLKNNQELQLNVTRRINRPNFFQLFPFTDYSDSLNFSRGNPNLKPEFTYSSEISYSKQFSGGHSFMSSLYFKYTDNLITRFQDKEINPVSGEEVFINTYINANSSYVGGLELIARDPITKWWDLTSSLNLFTSKIDVQQAGFENQGNVYSWFAKVNNSFKLPMNFSVQLSGDYQSKTVLPPGGSGGGGGGGGRGPGGGGGGGFFGGPQSSSQGYIRPNYGVDIALRYEFMKEKRASLTLSFSDVLRTRRSDVYTQSDLFIQNSFRRRDPQFFRLNFSWRFGKFDTSLFKRKNMRGEAEGMQNGMQGVQQ